EVVEQDLRIGLRPQPNAAGRRALEGLLETLCLVDAHDEPLAPELEGERVPRARGRRDVANRIDDGALALRDREVQEVVFERVRANAEVTATGRDPER